VAGIKRFEAKKCRLILRENQLTDQVPGSRLKTDGADFPTSSDTRQAAQASASHEAGPMRHCACEVGNQEVSMTTTIKVIAQSWPVEVTTTDHGAGCSTDIVEPNSERDFYVHSTRSLGIVELPEPAKAAEPEVEVSTAVSEDGTVEGVSA
jgi:hypothetical protein